jgi:hypothetical protein
MVHGLLGIFVAMLHFKILMKPQFERNYDFKKALGFSAIPFILS